MPISKAELARHWGVSRTTVIDRCKLGCPLNSIRAAELWWEKRVHKRAPVSGPNVGKFAVEHEEGLEPIGGVKKPGRPFKQLEPSNTGDGLADSLKNAVMVEEAAFKMVTRALHNQSTNVASLLHVHTKASEHRAYMEKSVREEQERRGLLVNKTIMSNMVRRTMEPVLRRLRRLPQERGPECADARDHLAAVGILEKEVNSIIAVGRKNIDDFLSDRTTEVA